MGKRARDDELKEEVHRAIQLVGGEYKLSSSRVEDLPNSLTPFEKQMVSLKKSLPPYVILLIACGYRVRCFGRDSHVVSRRTGIMCVPAKPFEYSSLPYIRVDVYIQRLIAMGYHVAFADQESAAVRAVEGKTNIFTRSISQVYSRGTFLPGEHVQTIGELAAEAAAGGRGGGGGASSVNTTPLLGDVGHEEDEERREESEYHDSFLSVAPTSVSSASTLLFLEYHVRNEACPFPNSLEIVLLNFVNQQRVLLRIEIEDAEGEKIESNSLAAFQDALQRFDIAELILLGPLVLTSAAFQIMAAEPLSPRMVTAAQNQSPECCGSLGDLVRQHLPRAVSSLLTQYLSLQWGPTITGEEDGGAVSMAAGWKRADQSMEEAILEYLRPYQLQDIYHQLVEEWNRDASIFPSISAPTGELLQRKERVEANGKGGVHGTEPRRKVATMTVPGGTLYALHIFPSSHFPVGTRNGGGEKSTVTSLFQILNATVTPTGSRRLREWVAAPLRDYEDVLARQRVVRFLATGEDGGVIKKLLREAAGGRGGGSGGSGMNCGVRGSCSMDMEAILARLHGHRCQVLEFIRFLSCLSSMAAFARQLEQMDTPAQEEEEKCGPHQGGASTSLTFHEEAERDRAPHLLQILLQSLHPPALEAWASSHGQGLLQSRATTPFELFSSGELAWPPAVNVQLHLAKAAEAEKQLQDELSFVRSHLGIPTLEYRAIAGTPYVIDIPNTKAEGLAKSNWIVLSRTKANVRYHTPKIVEASTILAATKERIVGASRQAWTAFQEELFQDQNDVVQAMKEAVDALGAIDALHSLSITARRQGYVAPHLVPPQQLTHIDSTSIVGLHPTLSAETDPLGSPRSPPFHDRSVYEKGTILSTAVSKKEEPAMAAACSSIAIRQGRHPVADEILHHQYVACDITLQQGNTILLTGPNMGGKSAFMRMVGIFVLMAQIGSYVPAESATLPLFDGLYSRMGASDNVLAGKSTFLTEIEETSRILASPYLNRSLVLMDELGRGTSSYDGMAVASATLEYLATKGATSIFVTHYASLCEPYALDSLRGSKSDPMKRGKEEDSMAWSSSSSLPLATASRVQCYFMGYKEEDNLLPLQRPPPFNEASEAKTSSVKMDSDEKRRKEEHRTAMKGRRILFTYRPCRGVTPSSFGIQVAMMAGLPFCVTEEAEKQSKRVESLYQLTRDITQLGQFMLKEKRV